MFKIIKDNRGAAMVEFALILAPLLVLIFGIIEFSVALYDKGVISSAAREGARWATAYYIDPNPANTLTYAKPVQPSCSDVKNHIMSSVLATYPLISLSGSPQVKGCCGQNCTPSTSWPSNNGSYAYQSGVTNIGNGDSVTVQYQYDFLVLGNLTKLLPGGSILPNLALTSTSLMRDENQGH